MSNRDVVLQLIEDAASFGVARDRLERFKDAMGRLNWMRNPILPRSGESVGVSFYAPKTAALFFDRVSWAPLLFFCPDLPPNSPEDVIVYPATKEDADFFDVLSDCSSECIPECLYSPVARPVGDLEQTGINERRECEHLFRSCGIVAIPLYSSPEPFDRQYAPGDTQMLIAAIKDLAIIREERLQWDQVMEFRRDLQARTKLRRMRHWMDSELIGKPVSYVSDEIALRLSDYEWALKKHGLETVVGSLSLRLKPRFVLGASAIATILGMAAGEFWASAGVLTLLAGEATVHVASRLVDLEDTRRGENSEVAFIYDLKKRTGSTLE